MTRRFLMNLIPALLGGILVGPSAQAMQSPVPPTRPAASKPNVIVILADDLGWGDVSCNNPHSRVPTPHIDRLAARGIRFTDAHAPDSVCTPTRYGLLTGRYAWRGRLKRGVLSAYSPPLIEQGRLTLGGLFKQQGYTTAAVGKWHLGMDFFMKDGRVARNWKADGPQVDFSRPVGGAPVEYGFDYNYVTPACPGTQRLYVYVENRRVVEPATEVVPRVPGHWTDWHVHREGLKAPGFKFDQTDLVFLEKSKAFITRAVRQGKPFFLYHAPHAIHLPADPAPQFVGKSRLGPLGDFIIELDYVVGQLVETCRRLGVEDQTLIVFTSDNGPEVCCGRLYRFGHDSAGGLRGLKRDSWEGGHRVPFIACWPGRIPAGVVCDQTICLTDLIASFAALLDVALPDDAGEDSADILPALLGERTDRPARGPVIHHSATGLFSIRHGRWKLINHAGSGAWNYRDAEEVNMLSLRDRDEGTGPVQLYDLSADLKERNNLAPAQPQRVKQMQDLLEKLRQAGRSVER